MNDQRTTLLLGGRIHTPGVTDATAMAVTAGTVAWVGQDSVGRALHPDAEIVHLEGAFVAPAFVDAHVHATATGLHLAGIDLTAVRGGQELLAAVADAATPGEVLIAHGWDESNWTDTRIPSRAELDAAAGGTPVYLSRVDVHSALVSTALVDLAPRARELDGFTADGPLTREAHHAVRGAAREAVPAAQRRRAQRAFLDAAAAAGIASVHECGGPAISGEQDLAELRTAGTSLDVPEVVGYWGERCAVDTARRLGARGLAGDLFADGALGSRTAALRAPYTDCPGTGGAGYLDAEAVGEHVAACTEAGLQAGFHVIGDAAADEVLAGFRLAEKVVGARALAGAGHRLEHLEMIDADQARALGNWSVTASMQPLFDAAWGGAHGMYATRLGRERAAELNPFAMLAAEGVPLAFGSDSPVTPLKPWAAVRAAVHHRTEGHGLSPRAAFNAHTRGAHRAAGVADGVTGTLVPGAPAHYAVWDASDLVAAGSDTRVQRWSTDPKSGVPALPPLDPDTPLPRCLRTVRAGQVQSTDHTSGRRARPYPGRVSATVAESSSVQAADPAGRTRRWPWAVGRLALAAAGGGLLFLSYAPRELWWLAPLAFTCLGLVLLAPGGRPSIAAAKPQGAEGGRGAKKLHGRKFWPAAGYGFAFGLTFYLGQLYWIQHFLGGSFGPSPWLGLSTVLAVYVALACGLMTFVARLPAAPIWMAALYLLQGFARTWWPAGGFPWGKVAFSQPDGAFTSLASLGGSPLVGLAVLVSGFGLAQLIVRAAAGGLRPARGWAAPVAAVLLPVVAGLAAWPTVGTAAQAGTRTVAVVQGNAPNIGVELLDARGILRNNHLAQSRELLAAIRAGEVPPPDLVIWPETATALELGERATGDTGSNAALRRLARAFGVPMLVGARIELPNGTPQNLVVQFEPGKGVVDRYAKQQLVPFAEYIPLRGIASWFSPFVATTVDMKPGTETGVFQVAGTEVGVAICYEVAYDYALREATNAGAQLLVIPTNNAWFGDSEMSYQQLAMARLRAVEHGRAVVVAATSGVSAIVRPDGSVVSSTELYTADSLVRSVPLRTETTLADRLGASVEYALIGIAVAALAAGVHRGRRQATTRREQHVAGRTRPAGPSARADRPGPGGDPDL